MISNYTNITDVPIGGCEIIYNSVDFNPMLMMIVVVMGVAMIADLYLLKHEGLTNGASKAVYLVQRIFKRLSQKR